MKREARGEGEGDLEGLHGVGAAEPSPAPSSRGAEERRQIPPTAWLCRRPRRNARGHLPRRTIVGKEKTSNTSVAAKLESRDDEVEGRVCAVAIADLGEPSDRLHRGPM